MIKIENNKVIIAVNDIFIIQDYDPESGKTFENESECFSWIIASGWFNKFKQIIINMIKEKASQEIYNSIPNFKQVNAALGLYSETDKNSIINTIQTKRDEIDIIEQNILAATTLDEVKSYLISS